MKGPHESITEIKDDLIQLKRRLNHNAGIAEGDASNMAQAVKVIYIDNCCTIGDSLVEIFPGAKVKLDVFHFLQRWDECLMSQQKNKLVSSKV